ncbi:MULTISPECIES: peptidase E [unclassified Modestobacter]|uniref:Type 1 glutamine amidotransferase-like domain-containing protein n=1 Tax=unclassified Modestobacter TaxID=2643866 RepID=UPI0022AA71EF|nr:MULTISPECIES: peptidase E [unclassified Modestobacter]MCZ2823905.1 peptidase E [Modestobacter sp. VKM Ac-2981]MCZ2852150.1 peptidase E [Modestobacter sp. VKM Ac-2982]
MRRQVFAFSGVIQPRPGERGNRPLLEHVLALGAARRTDGGPVRLCYLPTAVGDDPAAVSAYQRVFGGRDDVVLSVLRLFPQPSVPDVRSHLLTQDVVLVEGGSVVNLMAVWRAHGLHTVLRECWEAGVVLAGPSAGSLCWHVGGPTDSWSDRLDPFTDGLGFLPYSNGVHDDLTDQPRRETYRRLVAAGTLPAGHATEDGVGLHYVGSELAEAVTVRPGARAWRVDPDERNGWTERAITPREI